MPGNVGGTGKPGKSPGRFGTTGSEGGIVGGIAGLTVAEMANRVWDKFALLLGSDRLASIFKTFHHAREALEKR